MSLATQKTLESSYVMRTFGRSEVEFVGGRGMTLVDAEGREYLDFLAGIGVCCLGHGHPAVTGAVREQAERLMHVSNYFYIEHRGEVAALISKLANDDMAGARLLAQAMVDGDEEGVLQAAALAPGEQVWETFFANSGAEANEGSMKLARLFAKRAGNGGNTIVCLRGGFHGRTLETIAATMQDWLQESFTPLPGGFAPCTPNDVDELRSIFDALGSEICAVMLEPIQGESGVHPLTAEFMEAARDLAHEHGALLIADEVQTGVFRTGKPFAFQTYGVEPDIMSLAKGIAGGVPAGACVAKKEIADVFRPGDHGSTFGGSCLAVAAAAAVLAELTLGAYDERASEVGAYAFARLGELDAVAEVRGRGLMLGCDLAERAGDAHDVVAAMLTEGFVINATGPHTLRFLPPLICSEADIDRLVQALARVLG
ncbi:aminotransferase class III-fold pyridoxal phosphate-dependent enzyme [Collinsella stercoris]|uniref:Aminotransferase, acetylornithine/succinylornithine family n=1 Tax=Collinsella stercoris DSM 13279 TaxID=445975 RepID=B6GAZ6_9ACTN|nr:aminotransferase class III-fold pyridoxal phosphate-dependent enzyme [Collinsella stercoris]EEA90490.1 aminotransferase, acetylornithine/succinylornithine family [Collinsella stercoris DSM 13279]UEA45596.1 aminotransferase class III-fold pyridoxal phosphate-dependent enzyme [Collinsella stercoris DSM 13279]UWP11880.1 aminotransferase class III-fold pyridoxal phosphate-dependent enzyme [Collinsella stercoris]